MLPGVQNVYVTTIAIDDNQQEINQAYWNRDRFTQMTQQFREAHESPKQVTTKPKIAATKL